MDIRKIITCLVISSLYKVMNIIVDFIRLKNEDTRSGRRTSGKIYRKCRMSDST